MYPLINKIIRSFVENLLVKFYNEFTIEDHFRKKGYQIGTHNRIFIRSLGSEPYLIKIGSHCTITRGVKFITHDGGAWVFRKEIPDLNVFGKIEIKDNCFIGIDSIILPGIIIGPNSVVGAGSVVTKNVPPNSVVAGVPAKKICSIEEYKEKCIKKWKEIGLGGSRKTWKEQLVEHFWDKF